MFQKLLGFLLILVGLWLSLSPIDYSSELETCSINPSEEFNPGLTRLNSIHKTQEYIDSIFLSEYREFDSFQYFQTVKEVVKQKFCHGNAAFSWKENWICFLLGKFVWSHFNSIVSPNEVVKHSTAMCSQQTMVFTRIMAKKGFTYRYIYLNNTKGDVGHFCCDIWLGNDWHFVDVNQEPNWGKIKGLPNQNIDTLVLTKNLDKLYTHSAEFMQDLKAKDVKVSYGLTNEKLGVKMMLFQFMTKWLSYIIPIFLGLFLIYKGKRNKTI